MKKETAIILGVIVALARIIGFVLIRNGNAIESEEEFGGRSGPVRDIIGTYGTPTATTTAGEWLFSGLDVASVATTSGDAVLLLQSTDSVLFTIETTVASSTNFFAWHIVGSNDPDCDTLATTTTGDNYVPTVALVEDINWYDLIAADVTPTKYDNVILTDTVANATGTSFLLTDVNWNCLKTEYRGASTTILMQMKEKILTIQ